MDAARGYLVEGADRDEIVRAVLAVAGGDAAAAGRSPAGSSTP